MTTRSAVKPRLALRAFVVLAVTGTLSSCSTSGPAVVSTHETTVCAPAKIGEPFIVGDIMTMPAGEAPIVKSIDFAEESGVKVIGQAAFTTAHVAGYYLYPVSQLQSEDGEEWTARTELPSTGPIAMDSDPDGDAGARQRSTIVAIVERTGDASGFLRSPQIVYQIGGMTYHATGTIAYRLTNGRCDG